MKTYNKGDKLIAVENCYPWLTKGKEYVVEREHINDPLCIHIQECDNDERNLSFFKSRFTLLPSEMPLGEQVELARTFLGKKTSFGYCEDIKVCVTEKQADERSFSCQTYFKNHGFCVAIMSTGSIPLPSVSLLPESKTIKLTDDYDVEIFKNEVKVGCQTVSIEMIKEILTIAEAL